MFAVLDSNNIVTDCWIAHTLEEAKSDNLDKKIIEVTIKTLPFTIGEKYITEE